MTLNAVERKALPVYGDGLQVRDWLYVEDHCQALRMVLQRAAPGETYNIGANCEHTNLEVVQRVCDLVDEMRPHAARRSSRELIEHVADRPGHDRRYAIDASKIRREIGWRPRHEFESALRHTIEWYLNNSWWVERVTSGSYQRERIGLAA
jgi:dTDP-glucose 4,6-dehydratase